MTRGDGTEGGEEILAHGWEGLAKVVQEDLVDLKIGRLDRRSGYPLASITTKAPVGLKIQEEKNPAASVTDTHHCEWSVFSPTLGHQQLPLKEWKTCKIFLAVQDSSIGDLLTHSLTDKLID